MIAFIGIGANLGDARANVADALARLDAWPGCRLHAASSCWRTAPIDSSGDDYINAVALLDTDLGAHELLATLHAVETAHGRERPYRNAPRTLDLDLLLYGDEIIDTPALTVFVPFAMFYMNQPFKLDYVWAALCLVGAVYFIFRS